MEKNKPKKVMRFDVDDVVLGSDLDDPFSHFATAELTVFSTGLSLHDTICNEESLRKTAPTIYETPIVYEYDKRFSDFGTHSDVPIIAGFIVPDTATFYKREDGRTSMKVSAKIWRRYAKQFLEILSRGEDGKRSVSVEMEVYDFDVVGEYLELKDWIYTAVCVLGELVSPASPGAELEMIKFANDEYKKAYSIEFGTKYSEIDFTIPPSVKKEAKNALAENKGSAVALAMARFLVKNEKITPERVRRMASYFKRDASLSDTIEYKLYGGNAGRKWSTKIASQMDEMDEKEMSYFAGKGEEDNLTAMKKDKNKAGFAEQEAPEEEPVNEEMAEKEDEAKPVEDEMAEKPEGREEPVKEEMADEKGEEEKPVEEEMAEEDVEEDDKEEDEFSLADSLCRDSYLMSVMDEEEKAKMLADNPKTVFEALMSVVKRVTEENGKLIEFKHSVDEKQKEHIVATTLVTLTGKFEVPSDELEKMKELSKEYSLEKIDEWKTVIKAKAVDFAMKETDKAGETFVYALPFDNGVKPSPNDVWATN